MLVENRMDEHLADELQKNYEYIPKSEPENVLGVGLRYGRSLSLSSIGATFSGRVRAVTDRAVRDTDQILIFDEGCRVDARILFEGCDDRPDRPPRGTARPAQSSSDR